MGGSISFPVVMFRPPTHAPQVSFRGNGPLGNVMAISDARGNVKGRVDNPSADPPLRDDGKLAVGVAVGEAGSWTYVV